MSERPVEISRCEERVSELFAAWNEGDIDAVLDSLIDIPVESREVSVTVDPPRRTSDTRRQFKSPIEYIGKEQIRPFVDALTPGFHSEVTYLKARGPSRGLFGVSAVVAISAELLENAGIGSAEAGVYAGLVSPLRHENNPVFQLRFRFEQETFEKLEEPLPDGLRREWF